MPTSKSQMTFTPESNEKDLLKQLAEEEGVSMSRMMGLLIRRAWKQREQEMKRNVQTDSSDSEIRNKYYQEYKKRKTTSPPQT